MEYGAEYQEVRNKHYPKKARSTKERTHCCDPHCSGECGGASCAEIKFFLDRCLKFSMADCLEIIVFSQRLYSREWDKSNVKRGRALVAVLCVSNRIKNISEADKATPLAASEVLSRTEELIRVACSQWSATKEMKNTVLEMHPLLKGVVADALCCSVDDLASFDDEAMFNAFCKCGK
jgi:hypothetical protein